MDCTGIVWDLRIGRAIIVLQGHVKPIYCLDWSPNGYHIATGSEDNTIKIWDVRMANILYTIPAHKNIVTNLHYWKGVYHREHRIKSLVNTIIPDTSKDVYEAKDGGRSVEQFVSPLYADNEIISHWDQTLGGCFLISSSYDGSCCIWSSGDYKMLKKLMSVESKIMSCDVTRDARYIVTASYDKSYKIYEVENV